MRPTLTPAIIHAAATDAGNASMRRGGREKWSVDDYNAAAHESDRLYVVFDGHEETGRDIHHERRRIRHLKRDATTRTMTTRGEK